jgi:hypothetical protein
MSNKIYSNTNRPVSFVPGSAVAVTKSDTDVFSAGSLYVGTGGDVAVKMSDSDTTVIFANVPDGTFMPISITQVLSTGTDADDFIVLY